MHTSYEIVTHVDCKTDSDEILSILNKISKGILKNDLKLINYYQEMPISYGTIEIEECGEGVIDLFVHQKQTVVIMHQKQTIIKSKHFPDGLSVHAIAKQVNIKKSYVSLGGFVYASNKAERRDAIRVKLQEKIPVTIKANSGMFTGVLDDISVGGVKIKDSDLSTVPGNAVLEIKLPECVISMPGTFIRESVNENGRFYVFTVKPDARAETLISKMIYARQVELINMLNEQFLHG